MNQDQIKKIAVVAGAALGAFFLYRIIVKKQSPMQAAEDTIQKPVEIVKSTADAVIKTTKRLLKGSPEAKEYMAKLSRMKKGKVNRKLHCRKCKVELQREYLGEENRKRKMCSSCIAKSQNHKGHATKKGLAQDQKLISKEKHEKAYRKGRYDK